MPQSPNERTETEARALKKVYALALHKLARGESLSGDQQRALDGAKADLQISTLMYTQDLRYCTDVVAAKTARVSWQALEVAAIEAERVLNNYRVANTAATPAVNVDTAIDALHVIRAGDATVPDPAVVANLATYSAAATAARTAEQVARLPGSLYLRLMETRSDLYGSLI